MLSVSVEVDEVRVEGPGEGEVEGGVMWRGTLHPGTLAHTDVSVGGGQSDLRGVWGERERDTGYALTAGERLTRADSRGHQWDAYPSHHTQNNQITNSTRL